MTSYGARATQVGDPPGGHLTAAVGPRLHAASLWVNPEEGTAGIGAHALDLGAAEVAALAVLLGFAGRVVSRQMMTRRCGMRDQSARRVDSLLVGIRRALGPDAIVTVRSRGWILDLDEVRVPADGLGDMGRRLPGGMPGEKQGVG